MRAPSAKRHVSVPPIDTQVYAPTSARPLSAKLRHLAADTRVDPHSHPWAQISMSSKGVIRMTAGDSTYLVPPQRALWIPPGVEHVVENTGATKLYCLTLMTPNEGFAELIRNGTPVVLPVPCV